MSNVKRSVKEATKPFEKFSFGELRRKYRSQMEEGLSVKQSRGRIERGEVCFVAGTLIQTKEGEKKIEEIEQGDEVLFYDEQTQAFEYKAVVRTFERYSEEILSVKIASETESLGVTPEHPFYVRVHGARSNLSSEDADNQGEWKAANALEIGDEVLQSNGTWSFVESVTVRESGAKVYNFEVFDNHNYFVGEQGTLVHNTCGGNIYAAPLNERLSAYKQWKQNTGKVGAPNSSEFRSFVGAHRPNSRGATLYGDADSGFSSYFRGHGNSKNSSVPAELYAKFDGDGNFMKWGISQDSATRYSGSSIMYANGRGRVDVLRSGNRADILARERRLTERFPGPENLEPWAGIHNPNHPNYIGPRTK